MAHWHTISDDASVIAKTVVAEGDVLGNVVVLKLESVAPPGPLQDAERP
jgi:hypothetical protein